MQDNWQWCNRCMGLSYFGNGALGACPAGGEHDHRDSGNYALAEVSEGVSGQHEWRWCRRCQGLYFVGNGSHGYCPAGGAHIEEGSGDYVLSSAGSGQHGWRWCRRCQGLFYGAQPQESRCPAPGGGPHATEGSGDYVLEILNEPAAPPPVNTVVVRRTGERSFDVGWSVELPLPRAADRYDVFESTGPFPDRFIASVGPETFHLPVSVWGDFLPNLGHCFTVHSANRYGRSPGVRACSPPPAPPPPPPPAATAASLVFRFDVGGVIGLLSAGHWVLTGPAGDAHVVDIPRSTDQATLPHPGPQTSDERWTAYCEAEFWIYQVGGTRTGSPIHLRSAPISVSWATNVGPTLVATVEYRPATGAGGGGGAAPTLVVSQP